VARHHAAIVAADPDGTACVAELVGHRLRAAVDGILTGASPDPAEQEVACLVAADGGRVGPAQRAAADALHTLLRGAVDAERARQWVTVTLGAPSAQRVAQVEGVLCGEAVDVDARSLVALLWLAAAAAAVGTPPQTPAV
jgi:hypothetical protein